MTTNNEYYKRILERLTGTSIIGNYSDNYYLHRISMVMGNSYLETTCNGIYLKDIAEVVCVNTYHEQHFNNYYLHQMAEHYTGTELDNNSDNYFLNIISQNIVPPVFNPTKLSIVVPATLVYNDSFNITGVLSTDETESTVISGENVHLYVGNTLVDTKTTGTNGEVSFTHTPVSMGTHTFRLVYDGKPSEYNSCTSEDVTRNINKETAVLQLSTPSDYTVIEVGDNLNVSGVLTDNDSPSPHGLGDKEIVIYDITDPNSPSVFDTTYTDNNGEFESVNMVETKGNYILKIEFEGDENYTSSSQSNIHVGVYPPIDSITALNVPSILSYGDVASMAINVYDSNSEVIEVWGLPIKIYKDGTLVTTLYTDENGDAGYVYESTGIGDVTITAECMSITETYSIEDCIYFNDGSSVGNLNTGSVTVTSNGEYITMTKSGSESYVTLPVTLTGDWEYEVELANIQSGATTYFIPIYFTLSTYASLNKTSFGGRIDNVLVNSSVSINAQIGDVLTFKYVNGTLSAYYNGTFAFSGSVNLNNQNCGFYQSGGRVSHVKNLKFKPL